MKIFLFLNDCVLGENTNMELFFAFIKHKSFNEIKQLMVSRNKKQILNDNYNLINFNNLFLREEVIHWVKENYKEDEDEINIVSDLKYIPIELFNLNASNIKTISYDEYNSMDKTHSILVTGEIFINYNVFFNCKKILFVGPYLLGKLVNMWSVGRTEIIHRPYGIFTILWDNCINLFTYLDILWILLFFLPSTDFAFWIRCFIITSILSGIGNLWRQLLELEQERQALVNGEEVLMGGNFLYLHYSTYGSMVLSLLIYFSLIIYMIVGLHLKVFLFSTIYGIGNFLFITRTFRERLIGKIIILLIGTTLVQYGWVGEMINIIIGW